MPPMKPLALVLLALVPAALAADLKPLMAVPDQVVLQDDFTKPGPLNKQQWTPRQGTQWKIAEGVLHGSPSTPEYQAKKKIH